MPTEPTHVTAFVDAAVTERSAAIAVTFENARGPLLETRRPVKPEHPNTLEYLATIEALTVADRHGWHTLTVGCDNAWVVREISKEWDCRNKRDTRLRREVHRIMRRFRDVQIVQVLRGETMRAHQLAVTARRDHQRVESIHGDLRLAAG